MCAFSCVCLSLHRVENILTIASFFKILIWFSCLVNCECNSMRFASCTICTEYDADVFIYFIKINWACIRRHIQVWLSTIKSMSYSVYAVFFSCVDKFNYYYRRQATSSNDVNRICVGINEAIQWIFSFKGDWFEITSILICLQLFYIIFLLQNDLVVGRCHVDSFTVYQFVVFLRTYQPLLDAWTQFELNIISTLRSNETDNLRPRLQPTDSLNSYFRFLFNLLDGSLIYSLAVCVILS